MAGCAACGHGYGAAMAPYAHPQPSTGQDLRAATLAAIANAAGIPLPPIASSLLGRVQLGSLGNIAARGRQAIQVASVLRDAVRPRTPRFSEPPLAEECPPAGCIVRELGALGDAAGRHPGASLVTNGTPLEVLGAADGTILVDGVPIGPRRWMHVRFRAEGGGIVEGWMLPENVVEPRRAFASSTGQLVVGPPEAEPTSRQLFDSVQRAIGAGQPPEVIGTVAAQFNEKRIGELTAAGVLQQIDAALADGVLRVPIWLGWTQEHRPLPPFVPADAPPKPLAIAGYVEIADRLWADAARWAVERALAQTGTLSAIASDGPPNGWFYAIGIEGDPLPVLIFYSGPAAPTDRPVPLLPASAAGFRW